MLYENTGSYTPDFAAEIDSEEEIAADEYGVGLETARRILRDRQTAVRHNQAQVLGGIIGQLLASNNIAVEVHSLAIAFGFDQLNGFHSQTEIAQSIGCTRSNVSHNVVGWRDALSDESSSMDCLKFRKNNETRDTYKAKATSATITAKRKRYEHYRPKNIHKG